MNKPWAHALMTRWFPWKGKDSHEFIVQAAPASNRLPEAFWQEMTRNIYSHSLAIFREVFWTDDVPAAFLRCEPLIQFGPLFKLERNGTGERWPLQGAGGFSFLVRGASCRERWAGLQYPETGLHNSHPEWQLYEAISAFAQMPTRANLEKQLSTISLLDLDWGLGMRWLRL